MDSCHQEPLVLGELANKLGCHRPTYSLGRCRSVTRGFAARFQMHFQVLSSSGVGWVAWDALLSWVFPPWGALTSGGPAGCGKEGGWLGLSVFVGGPGPRRKQHLSLSVGDWSWPSEGELSWEEVSGVDSALSSVHPSRPGLVHYKRPIEPKAAWQHEGFQP